MESDAASKPREEHLNHPRQAAQERGSEPHARPYSFVTNYPKSFNIFNNRIRLLGFTYPESCGVNQGGPLKVTTRGNSEEALCPVLSVPIPGETAPLPADTACAAFP